MLQKLLLILSGLFFTVGLAGKNTTVIIEAELFQNKGGWVIDQQFMDEMGSPYIMAHGLGIAVEDASTTVKFPQTGKYYLHVRIKNKERRKIWKIPQECMEELRSLR